MAIAQFIRLRDKALIAESTTTGPGVNLKSIPLYHFPTGNKMAPATKAAIANQIMECCPYGMIIIAASNGPIALPPLPPN